ncbi:hypothetical protein KM043_008321 [Ampulex compressa]|nr:hypothetical protein KM043_008321 [Ampulex compressa]
MFRRLQVQSRIIGSAIFVISAACKEPRRGASEPYMESNVSPAALSMIRLQHDGGGVTRHQGFTEATDRYTTSYPEHSFALPRFALLCLASTFSSSGFCASVTVAQSLEPSSIRFEANARFHSKPKLTPEEASPSSTVPYN